jgi:hypothetical protein
LGGIGYDYLMIDKTVETLQDAVSVIEDSAVILISGFGKSGNARYDRRRSVTITFGCRNQQKSQIFLLDRRSR